MKVLLISANTEKINMSTLPLGLACVATATQKSGHEVAMVDLMMENDPRLVLQEAIEGFRPNIIGVSVRNIDDQNMENPRLLLDPAKDIVISCRNLSEAPIVLGGAGYSIFPESALSFLGADMGIQGEGEVVFPELIRRIEQGADLSKLPGLYLPGHGLECKRVFVNDLDKLPLPEPDLWSVLSKKEEIWMPFQTRRGCPLNCSYCSTGTIEGRPIRSRSPEVVVQWMVRWREAGIRQFYFVDNTFNLPLSYSKEICRKLIDYDLDIRWWSIIYPKRVDEELVRLMARSGCKHVSLGSESGSERILKNMNKRFTLKEVRQISEMISNHGINQMGFLLLGSPGETRESVEESLVYADSLKLDTLKITEGVRIYPHTPLAKIALDEGVISSKDNLLLPRFYLAKGLEGWLPETLKTWMAPRPHWMI
jgi:radical SAM superfamily enzyme YgiQ (UPF0313 family)